MRRLRSAAIRAGAFAAAVTFTAVACSSSAWSAEECERRAEAHLDKAAPVLAKAETDPDFYFDDANSEKVKELAAEQAEIDENCN